MELITRKEARSLGLTRYFTGKPCINGHIVERHVSNKNCVECLSNRTMVWMKNNSKEYYSTLERKKKQKFYSDNHYAKPENKERHRAGHIFRTYGITLKEFDELLEKQNFRCAVCDTDEPRGRGWHIDHDHVYGHIRGILCNGCNVGLGHFKDDPFVMEQAVAYLEKRVVW